MLDDPHLNFAISTRSGKIGLDHMGLQVDDAGELAVLRDHMSAANISTHSDGETTCCYAKSEKSWVEDPNGIAWEAYHTMEDAQIYSGSDAERVAEAACCTPETPQGVCCAPKPELAAERALLRREGGGMTVTIYHNPACGTSRNVLGLIRNSGEEPRIIEYLKTPPSRDELVSLIGRMGIPVRDVLRRKGTPYDELGLDNPALTRRPADRRHDGASDPHQPADRRHAGRRQAVPAVRGGAGHSAAPAARRVRQRRRRGGRRCAPATALRGPHHERSCSPPCVRGKAPSMGVFERYLTLWVALCIVVGIALGQAMPGVFHALGTATVAQINLPVAVLVWLMVIPMLLKIDLAALGQVRKPLARHCRDGRDQLAGQAVLDGAARLAVHRASVPAAICRPIRSTAIWPG